MSNYIARVRSAVLAMDQEETDKLLFQLVTFDLIPGPLVRAVFAEAVRSAPHDVQEFWLGACNCDGHLN